MKRSLLFVLTAIAAIVVVTAVFLLQAFRPSPVALHGSLFVSDAGQSHGGFEYNAEWNATLTVEGSAGTLRLVLGVGLGDALTKHEYRITDFVKEPSKIRMRIEDQALLLVWIDNDATWNHMYDNYYIASWGSDTQPGEMRGTISPKIFPGLADHYYVELRLR